MLKFFKVLCSVILTFNLVTSQCPTIVTRTTWGARSVTGANPVLTIRPAPYVIIHQTGPVTDFCTTQAACQLQMRNTQNYHMDTRAWYDIAYSFAIGENNLVYTGRGWVTQGQRIIEKHVRYFNNLRNHCWSLKVRCSSCCIVSNSRNVLYY